MALETMINDKSQFLVDMLNRDGRLVNIGDLYLFQPIELFNKNITSYERRVPIDVKNKNVKVLLTPDFDLKEIEVEKEKTLQKKGTNDEIGLMCSV